MMMMMVTMMMMVLFCLTRPRQKSVLLPPTTDDQSHVEAEQERDGQSCVSGYCGDDYRGDDYGDGGDRGNDYGDEGDDFQTCALIPAKPYQSFHLALLLTCEGVSGQKRR